MTEIKQAVGQGAPNDPTDVTVVQTMLAGIAPLFSSKPPPPDGRCTDALIASIKELQFRLVGQPKPDGRIDPGGKSWKKLVALAPPSASAGPDPRLSGKAWFDANQARYPNSNSLDALEPVFGAKAKAFIGALRAAGATVSVNVTRRNPTRAWLMHYCCLVANDATVARTIPGNPDCDIIWDHKDDAATRRGAREMMTAFDIAFPAALKSRHIEGKAVDMTIGWTGTLRIKDGRGRDVAIGAPANGSNTALHAVGQSYGVVKLVSDPPHWSSDGH